MAIDSSKDSFYDSVPSSASPTSLPTSPIEFAPPLPPPPPPIPDHLRGQSSQLRQGPDKSSLMTQKFKSAPPNWLTSGYTLDDHLSPEPCEFRKGYYFFYGTLQNPETLSHVLGRKVKGSYLRPALTIGYSCELWGTYKALVDGPTGAIVEGVAYEVQCEEDETRLAAYETNAYETVRCSIDLKGDGAGSKPRTVSGKTFRYAGDPEALREKRFDRKLWVRNMAPEFKFRF